MYIFPFEILKLIYTNIASIFTLLNISVLDKSHRKYICNEKHRHINVFIPSNYALEIISQDYNFTNITIPKNIDLDSYMNLISDIDEHTSNYLTNIEKIKFLEQEISEEFMDQLLKLKNITLIRCGIYTDLNLENYEKIKINDTKFPKHRLFSVKNTKKIIFDKEYISTLTLINDNKTCSYLDLPFGVPDKLLPDLSKYYRAFIRDDVIEHCHTLDLSGLNITFNMLKDITNTGIVKNISFQSENITKDWFPYFVAFDTIKFNKNNIDDEDAKYIRHCHSLDLINTEFNSSIFKEFSSVKEIKMNLFKTDNLCQLISLNKLTICGRYGNFDISIPKSCVNLTLYNFLIKNNDDNLARLSNVNKLKLYSCDTSSILLRNLNKGGIVIKTSQKKY
jgi:hypothetical protein